MKFTTYSEALKKFLANPENKKTYDVLGPEYELMASIIEKRLAKGLTQSDLAEKVGTKQSAIARLESGRYNPSLAFLRKVAQALDAQLVVAMRSSLDNN